MKIPQKFEEEFKNIQNRYYIEDTDVGFIEEFLDGKKETCLEQIWREALKHNNPRDKMTKSDKERITNILLGMKNWKLYDGNAQHKKRISGFQTGYDGSCREISYGVQKAWVWYETEEEIEAKKKQQLEDKQNSATKVLNNLLNKNLQYKDYYKEV